MLVASPSRLTHGEKAAQARIEFIQYFAISQQITPLSIKHIEVHKVDENESVTFLSVPAHGNNSPECAFDACAGKTQSIFTADKFASDKKLIGFLHRKT